MIMEKPTDHPAIKPRKVGILFANLGTPDGYDYWSMRRYLNEFLSDKRVIDYPAWKWQPILQAIILTKRPKSSGEAYKSIWNEELGESPLMTITKQQVAKLQAELAELYGDQVMVDFCMRYGNPSTKSKLSEMVSNGCDRVLFFPLYPQYAGATMGTANDQFFRALMEEKWQPASRTIEPYFDDPAYVDALAQSVERGYAALDTRPDLLVVSYHGMPIRYLTEGDPYHCQCQKSTRLLRERLGWSEADITTTFQSVFGPEEWLKPYTVEEVARLAKSGKKNIAVIAPAFSADCIETLEEIQEEIQEAFIEAGGETFTYIPCLNDDDAHIKALVGVAERNLRGWLD
ncbi:Ferrochelatase [Aliiroseovarius sp. xm-m-379]|uniref:ferrochelatase n=1 Tax=unclassified Aliiroseovarius TaxID=2623558 RepID=UPI0015681DCA|nr:MULTISPECIES: ferrochelatase [unclassified Aliiroseovarius]NRP13368.1 Ferrochelatase [Aliiroseovarius sp. xm-d-517]NRP26007.1 Ferrochelatase [Aliiroseovarius sp. xm-m-379]NRP30374.1 Ferrochelatase [Aliiroseovarius sp. xm-m-314]NRP34806.1 Ferrochelatase [Aliiroseovarius sp. xm-a-104]NRP40157.1 Ferrochelatase [Aliiroseovarius sp. xm-m-339-2]